MKIIIGILIGLIGVLASGVAAFLAASFMAGTGMLGSCFEGSCGYAAVFLVFPLLSIGFTIAFFVGWWLWAKRRRDR